MILQEKDQLIAELKKQIENQTTQITNLSKQVTELNENVALLVRKNFSASTTAAGKNTLNTNVANKPTSVKRRRDHEMFRRAKNIKTTINDYFVGNSSDDKPTSMEDDGDEILDWNDDTENSGENRNLNNKNGEHNLTKDDESRSNEQTRADNDNWAHIASSAFKRESKPTPIQLGTCIDNDFNVLFGELRKNFAVSDFEWIHLRKTAKPRIVCATNDIKTKMMKFLQSIGCEFNTYADKNTKKSSYIVRGMHYEHDDDNVGAIKDSLNEYGIIGLDSVARFWTPAMKRSEDPVRLYKLVFNSGANVEMLKQIGGIDGFRVRIEKLMGSKTAQCRRCQRFTHVASSCHYKYRCVQCTQTHGPGNCPRSTNNKLTIGCINCLDGGFKHNDHTANDLVHCHFYQKHFAGDNKQTQIRTPLAKHGVQISTKLSANELSGQNRLQQATLDFNTPANGPKISAKKHKRMLQKYRPNVITGKSNNVSAVSSNGQGSKNFNLRDKKKLFEMFTQFMDSYLTNQ